MRSLFVVETVSLYLYPQLILLSLVSGESLQTSLHTFFSIDMTSYFCPENLYQCWWKLFHVSNDFSFSKLRQGLARKLHCIGWLNFCGVRIYFHRGHRHRLVLGFIHQGHSRLCLVAETVLTGSSFLLCWALNQFQLNFGLVDAKYKIPLKQSFLLVLQTRQVQTSRIKLTASRLAPVMAEVRGTGAEVWDIVVIVQDIML